MATTHKKVIVRKMDRDSVHGYVSGVFVSEGKLELMNTAGNVVSLDLRDVKGVYFVREFGDTETLTRKTFGAEGFSVIPPDQQSNTQRIFVPRSALAEMTVIGVIGEKAGRRGRRPEDTRQVPMFQ